MRLRFIGNFAAAVALGILGAKCLTTVSCKVFEKGRETFKKKVHEAVAEKE
ncbi:hypothetical protein [Treponema sp.]|uniref:hypothetical protein n=1 Tax=Treponema sp. TaxID=166 RepID=UPI0025DD3FF1|nr:hypothetical protein [Treponema sp.]MBR4322370.1 hypothetical protein [Treponema sp.]